MTQMMTIDLTCPQCGARDTAEAWPSINAALNPDEAQWLIDGFVFQWSCPSCGHMVALNYDCLYHDPERKVMVQYVSNKNKITEAAEALVAMRERGYEVRIVTSTNALREKAALCRDELDDRAVELLKFLLFNKFVGDGAIDGGAQAYYGALAEDGAILVEFIGGGEPQESSIPRDLYDSAVDQIAHLDADLLEALAVDRAWASKVNGRHTA